MVSVWRHYRVFLVWSGQRPELRRGPLDNDVDPNVHSTETGKAELERASLWFFYSHEEAIVTWVGSHCQLEVTLVRTSMSS